MMSFQEIESYLRKEGAKLGIKKIEVALSGGADSVALTLALKHSGFDVSALHCNFHLRGEESERDMEFVEKFCIQNEIPLEIKQFDTINYIKENKGISLEMACRRLRYDWFFERLESTGFDRIVVAHNADDNIETFLINLLRGSGTKGLKGMTEDNGRIWRPLLKFHRSEILAYLDKFKQNYVIDSSNLQSDFRRNFLRNEIIPLLKKEWKGFDTAMDKSIRNIEAENLVVERELEKILASAVQDKKLSVSVICDFPAPLLLVKRFLDPVGSFTTTGEEILDAIKANKPHIRRWRLKKGNAFLRNGFLFIEMGHGESRS